MGGAARSHRISGSEEKAARARCRAPLAQTRYERLEDGAYGATIPGLRGVLALGGGVEECRSELADATRVQRSRQPATCAGSA